MAHRFVVRNLRCANFIITALNCIIFRTDDGVAVDCVDGRFLGLWPFVDAHKVERGDFDFGLLRLDVKYLRSQLKAFQQELVFVERQVNEGKFLLELLEVPIAVFAGLVVHQTEQVDLLISQLVRYDTGDSLNTHLAAGAHTSVAGDDGVIHVHNNREQETEPLDTVLDLFNREVVVARVVFVISQSRDGNLSDIHSASPPVRNMTKPR